MLFAISLGFVAGPLLGSFLSDGTIEPWFTLSTPMYAATILSAANIFILWIFYKETHPTKRKLSITFHKSVTLFTSAFTTPGIFVLSCIFLCWMLAWSFYYQYCAVLMNHVFHFNNNQVGFFMSFIALGFGSTFLIFLPILTRFFKTQILLFAGVLVVTVGCVLIIMTHNVYLIWLSALLAPVGTAMAYTTSITQASDQVSADRQGWLMGVFTAVGSVCWTITAAAGGFILSWGVYTPFRAGAFFAILSLVLVIGYLFHLKKKSEIKQL